MESSMHALDRQVDEARQVLKAVVEALTKALQKKASLSQGQGADDKATLPPELILDLRRNIKLLKTKVERAVQMSTKVRETSAEQDGEDVRELEKELATLRSEVQQKNMKLKVVIDHLRALRLDLVLTKDIVDT